MGDRGFVWRGGCVGDQEKLAGVLGEGGCAPCAVWGCVSLGGVHPMGGVRVRGYGIFIGVRGIRGIRREREAARAEFGRHVLRHGGWPYRFSMECGVRVAYLSLAAVPMENTPCPCGNPMHWLVFYDPNTVVTEVGGEPEQEETSICPLRLAAYEGQHQLLTADYERFACLGERCMWFAKDDHNKGWCGIARTWTGLISV